MEVPERTQGSFSLDFVMSIGSPVIAASFLELAAFDEETIGRHFITGRSSTKSPTMISPHALRRLSVR